MEMELAQGCKGSTSARIPKTGSSSKQNILQSLLMTCHLMRLVMGRPTESQLCGSKPYDSGAQAGSDSMFLMARIPLFLLIKKIIFFPAFILSNEIVTSIQFIQSLPREVVVISPLYERLNLAGTVVMLINVLVNDRSYLKLRILRRGAHTKKSIGLAAPGRHT